MKKMPDQIDVTFTKEDRINAEQYEDINNCLMATALKRMGYNHDTKIEISGCGATRIGRTWYVPAPSTPFDARVGNRLMKKGPYYRKSVVGQTVRLVRCSSWENGQINS